MAHTHENCTNPMYGAVCSNGTVTGYCTDDFPDADWDCGNEYCVYYGHCDCKCHSGKTCECGHSWPRMEKK